MAEGQTDPRAGHDQHDRQVRGESCELRPAAPYTGEKRRLANAAYRDAVAGLPQCDRSAAHGW